MARTWAPLWVQLVGEGTVLWRLRLEPLGGQLALSSKNCISPHPHPSPGSLPYLLGAGGAGGEGRIIQDSSRGVDRPSLSPCTPWLVPLLEDAHEKAVWGEGRCWGRGTPQRLSAQTLCSDRPSFTPRPATLSSVTPPKPPFPLLFNGDNNSI